MEVGLLCLSFFLVALLYASVGHGGASGYLAVMALLSIDSIMLRPTALMLNIVVSIIGTIAFLRAGYFQSKLFWPIALSAIPFAYIGGGIVIDETLFRKILGTALCLALIRLFISNRSQDEFKMPNFWVMILTGAMMGLLSGLIGVGGGIFLTPIVILFRWAPTKTAAAISAPFILLNSIAGLAGLGPEVDNLHPNFHWISVSVLIAGAIGSSWGSRIAVNQQIRWALALVLCLAAFKLFL